MKKFKYVFYAIYILFFLFAGFIALYYEDLVLRWDWDSIDTWVGLLKFTLKMGGLGLVLFIIEIVIENIHVTTLNFKIKSLQGEVQELKAKLYDQATPETPTDPDTDTTIPEDPGETPQTP